MADGEAEHVGYVVEGTGRLWAADGVVLDLDAAGGIVGIDIDRASRRLDLATLETVALPHPAGRAA